MNRYSVEVDLQPEEAIKQSVAFFGEKGLGLDLVNQDEQCATFEGGGGYVSVFACPGDKVRLEIETREWDYHVKRFMRSFQS